MMVLGHLLTTSGSLPPKYFLRDGVKEPLCIGDVHTYNHPQSAAATAAAVRHLHALPGTFCVME